jgi:16S rRNA (guanine966-N2)-methyltransferase
MRIIAGRLGGLSFRSPSGHRTHPMSDKVRGALFNMLGDIAGMDVLDAFAGSGALGFEAISRGARSVIAIDNDRLAQQAIAMNMHQLKLDQAVHLIKATVSAWLATTDQQFDIILCDPPYTAIQPDVLLRLAERVKKNGILVFYLPPDDFVSLSDMFIALQSKSYGDATLHFYQRSQ